MIFYVCWLDNESMRIDALDHANFCFLRVCLSYCIYAFFSVSLSITSSFSFSVPLSLSLSSPLPSICQSIYLFFYLSHCPFLSFFFYFFELLYTTFISFLYVYFQNFLVPLINIPISLFISFLWFPTPCIISYWRVA